MRVNDGAGMYGQQIRATTDSETATLSQIRSSPILCAISVMCVTPYIYLFIEGLSTTSVRTMTYSSCSQLSWIPNLKNESVN